MSPEKQAAFQAAADKAIEWSTQEHLKKEARARELLQGAGPRRLHARREGLPRVRPEEVSRLGSRQELAGRHARQDQRDVSAYDAGAAGASSRRPSSRSAPLAKGTASMTASLQDHRLVARRARGEHRRRHAGRDVRRLPPADRLPLSAGPPDRLDARGQRHPVALARAVGRGLRRHASARKSASTSSTARSARVRAG